MSLPVNTNTSATGGYLLPEADTPPFSGLTFDQFLQQVLVGVSGLNGKMVRPKWQISPPKQPDITVNWLTFGLTEDNADTNAFVGINEDDDTILQRMEDLTLQCTFYGPDSLEYGKFVRDNFQIRQNLEVLQKAGMNFVSTSRMIRVPDVVNERWVDRWEMTVYLRREILRTYPVLTLLSGSGILKINDQGDGVRTAPIVITNV